MRQKLAMQIPAAANDEMIADAFRRNTHTRLPKYLCLHQAITDTVESGELAPGAQLPPEDKLARRLGLSIGTVRKAMQTLSDDGLLTRQQGNGTFVSDPSIDMHDVWHFRFLDDDGVSFLPLTARAIHIGKVTSDGPWRTIMPSPSHFIAVKRLINVADEFSMISDFYFDGDRFADLAELPAREFDRIVLRNILSEHCNVRTLHASQRLRCASLEETDAKLMNARIGSPCMILDISGHDTRERPIYYQRVVIPSTRRQLALD